MKKDERRITIADARTLARRAGKQSVTIIFEDDDGEELTYVSHVDVGRKGRVDVAPIITPCELANKKCDKWPVPDEERCSLAASLAEQNVSPDLRPTYLRCRECGCLFISDPHQLERMESRSMPLHKKLAAVLEFLTAQRGE